MQGVRKTAHFSQAFNPLGSISGVLIGTIFIFSGVELTSQQISSLRHSTCMRPISAQRHWRVVKPYLVLGAVAFLLALVILRTKFPAIRVSTSRRG